MSLKSLLRPAASSIRGGIASSSRSFASTRVGVASKDENNASVNATVLAGGSFLPEENMKRLTSWQLGLWERLAAEVRTNPGLAAVKQKWERSGLDIAHLLTVAARDPALGLAFNYGSLLLNNSFFLEGISDKESPLPSGWDHATSVALQQKIEAYAEGIVGGGWLWLVRKSNSLSDLDIIPTFAAGTLLVTQGAQISRPDLPLVFAPSTPHPETAASQSASEQDAAPATPEKPAPHSPPLNDAARMKQQRQPVKPASTTAPQPPIVPLAVLNLYELAWLGGKYGVWDKQRYAVDWFKHLNSSIMAERGRLS